MLRLTSDERLVELVRGGSEAAFEAIYDRHHRNILAFCRHMLGSADEAEDALQHTYLAAYRHLTSGGTAEINLRPWLYTIARNRCLSLLRARRERPLEGVREPATEHLSAQAQRRQDVRDMLVDVAALPDDQRAALVLAEIGAVSHDEIAMVLNVPRQKVKALVFQARTSLAASRKARETPCEEIREQLANLRGGALRRTTLHRHLRECPGCRAFREEVAMQRKTLAVALPVIPTLGLKEAALGAAFGSAGGAAGGAAATSGGAVAAKALVAVALVGGGTTAGVQVVRHAQPALPRPAPATPAPEARSSTAQPTSAGAVDPIALRAGSAWPTKARQAPVRPSRPAAQAPTQPREPRDARAQKHHAPRHGSLAPTPRGRNVAPGQAGKPAPKSERLRPGHERKPSQAAKPVPPGQAQKPAALEPPQAEPDPPGRATRGAPAATPPAAPGGQAALQDPVRRHGQR